MLHCQPWGRESTKNWKGTQPGQLTPSNQSDFPYHTMMYSAIKTGVKRREGEILWWHLSSHVTIMCNGVLYPWRWLNPREMVSEFPFSLSQLLLYLLNWLLEFSQFWSLIWLFSSHTLARGDEWLCGCVGFSCSLELNHNISGVIYPLL